MGQHLHITKKKQPQKVFHCLWVEEYEKVSKSISLLMND